MQFSYRFHDPIARGEITRTVRRWRRPQARPGGRYRLARAGSIEVDTVITFHDLRHSAATLMVERGVPLKAIQETLGHTSFAFTMDRYAHHSDALRAEVATRMEGVFEGEV